MCRIAQTLGKYNCVWEGIHTETDGGSLVFHTFNPHALLGLGYISTSPRPNSWSQHQHRDRGVGRFLLLIFEGFLMGDLLSIRIWSILLDPELFAGSGKYTELNFNLITTVFSLNYVNFCLKGYKYEFT